MDRFALVVAAALRGISSSPLLVFTAYFNGIVHQKPRDIPIRVEDIYGIKSNHINTLNDPYYQGKPYPIPNPSVIYNPVTILSFTLENKTFEGHTINNY
jgi:hypothetical protein